MIARVGDGVYVYGALVVVVALGALVLRSIDRRRAR